jgi:hypothetical protein
MPDIQPWSWTSVISARNSRPIVASTNSVAFRRPAFDDFLGALFQQVGEKHALQNIGFDCKRYEGHFRSPSNGKSNPQMRGWFTLSKPAPPLTQIE